MKEFIAQKNGKLTQILLKEGLNFSAIKKLYKNRDVKINGVRISKDCLVCSGDKISLYVPTTCYAQPLKIVFQDENLVVLDKPQGEESQDFFKRVQGEFPTAIFTHRLDRNTGGLIIFALNKGAYDSLFKALKDRTLHKYYTALVYGKMKKDSGQLIAYCQKDSKESFVSVFSEYALGRQKMITEYQTLAVGQSTTLLKVKLVTGRTHQIRCHLSFNGNFIIGDGKYGKQSINKNYKVKYQQLFASEIEFNFGKEDFLSYLNGQKILLKDIDIKVV